MSTFLGTFLIRSRLVGLLLLLFPAASSHAEDLLPGQSRSGSRESSTFTYHSKVSEVRLVFFATDERNHAVQELRRDDFAVVDNEMVVRNFRSFNRSGLNKLDVIVLMDSSQSVMPYFQQEITEVVQLISHCPWRAEDEISVLSFSGMEAHFVCTGNCRSPLATDQLFSVTRGGATPLFDAISIATNFLLQRRQPDTWPVIILFSDGDDTISKASFREALEKIMAGEVQVYAVGLNRPGQSSNGAATLQRIADDSGGRCVPITKDAVGIFSDIIEDLHSAHTVTYVLPESGSDFHSIRILPTHNLKLQFRCRRGYYRSGSAH